MYQNVKRTCRVLFWLINPIVLWRSRCRRPRRCVRSLLTPYCLLTDRYFELCLAFTSAEGCDPNHQVVKSKGKTAMHAAAAGGYIDIMACLRLVSL